MTAPTFTVEYCDEARTYDVVEWVQLTNNTRSGRVVFKDKLLSNAAAMAEEYQYNAEVHDWAMNCAAEWEQWSDQQSEFDYYGA
jgi:hypothetical protein